MTTIRILHSASAAERLDAARAFVRSVPQASEVLLVGASRDAIDEFARDLAVRAGVTFGLHRFSLLQLAWRLASPGLAANGLAPASSLSLEALAARVVFEARRAGALVYLQPVADRPGLPRALLATLTELRLAGVRPESIGTLDRVGPDLQYLATQFEVQLAAGRMADRAALLREATRALLEGEPPFCQRWPLLLLDVVVATPLDRAFVAALTSVAPAVLATIPAGDERTRSNLSTLPRARLMTIAPADAQSQLERLQRRLFQPDPVGPVTPDAALSEMDFFSAPGEGRESIELVRRIMDEARRGTPFDRIAIVLRAPQVYMGLLETALRRAGIPAWFARGTTSPDPAGRAFLALLACGVEGLSARRFAEYLSLGQVPELDHSGRPPARRPPWVAADEEWLRPALTGPDSPGRTTREGGDDPEIERPDAPVIAGTLRAPRRWERMLVEAAVIGGRDRWARRLHGLANELRLKRDMLLVDDPDSPAAHRLEDELQRLDCLRRFALPVIDALADLPEEATWGDWLLRLQALAGMVLRRPERVLAVFAELAPMAAVGPVSLHEVRHVLGERLRLLAHEPPARREGRVFIGTPDQVRARQFEVVLVPGLAERIFPQPLREDPLLLDEQRSRIGHGLTEGSDRRQHERLELRLAIGAAGRRIYRSYPSMQLSPPRPRVMSLYALDIERAISGRVPDPEALARRAALAGNARLAWPAPTDPAKAIDEMEHDLAVLGGLLHVGATREGPLPEVKGAARYLLRLNPALSRSLRARYARADPKWSAFDGLCSPGEEARAALANHRLRTRPYSASALQKFAVCPYQFLLSAIHRLKPREEATPLERLDPMTRGRMFHEVQAVVVRELQQHDAFPLSDTAAARRTLDETLDRISARYRDDLAPAVERVWRDEIESMRADLRGWLDRLIVSTSDWEPLHVEFGFGIPPGDGRDVESRREPATLPGGWKLHGVIDLIERRRDPQELRVTDYKTGPTVPPEDLMVGGGEILQPVLYGLALETVMQQTVTSARLFFCTSAGGFAERTVRLDEDARRRGVEVLEIVDRAVESGFLPPAPREGACQWCDFRDVCGPNEESRIARKQQGRLADLHALRERA